MTPTEWARNIKAPLDLAGMIMHLAARADEDNRVRCKMADLCDLFMVARTTINRYLLHLETLGVLTRETKRGGPNQSQVLRLHVETDPRKVSAAIRRSQTHTAAPAANRRNPAPVSARSNRRSIASVTPLTDAGSSQLGSTTDAGLRQLGPNRRSIAPVSELTDAGSSQLNGTTDAELRQLATDADPPASNRRNIASVSDPQLLPGVTSLASTSHSSNGVHHSEVPELSGVETSPVVESLAARVRARGTPPPPSTLDQPPVTLPEAAISEIVFAYRGRDPEGEDGVRFKIRSFLAHDTVEKWRRDPKQGAMNWVERELRYLRRNARQEATATAATEAPRRRSEFERFDHGHSWSP